jgi:hypothetical protein
MLVNGELVVNLPKDRVDCVDAGVGGVMKEWLNVPLQRPIMESPRRRGNGVRQLVTTTA